MPDESQNQTQTQQELKPELSTTEMMRQFLEMSKPKDKGDEHQSHGKTGNQMKELHKEQRNGKYVKTTANKDSNVEIEECNAHLIHAVLENPDFDRKTGKKLSTPFMQMFEPNDFKRMVREAAFHGMTVQIVHDPAAGTKQEAKIEEKTEQINTDTGNQVLSKNNIHTLSNKNLKIAYKNMFPDAANNVTPDAMRAQIITKIEGEQKDI